MKKQFKLMNGVKIQSIRNIRQDEHDNITWYDVYFLWFKLITIGATEPSRSKQLMREAKLKRVLNE